MKAEAMPHLTSTSPTDEIRSQAATLAGVVEAWNDPRSLTTFSTFRQGKGHRLLLEKHETSFSNGKTSHNGNADVVLVDSNSLEIPESNCLRISDGKNGERGHTEESPKDDTTDDDDCCHFFDVDIELSPTDRRFGFSVIGGFDEGFQPRIEQLTTGSPADKADLEVGDEILEVNGRSLENCTHTEIIAHIHQCIRSRTICLRVKRKTSSKLALDLARNSNVQDAFVIAVEQQARERLEKLSALKKIKPVDMTKLSQELNEVCSQGKPDLNGVIENNPIYITTVPEIHSATLERVKKDQLGQPNGQAYNPSGQLGYSDRVHSIPGHYPNHHQIHVSDSDAHDQEIELKQEIFEADETLSVSSPETPPQERLLIENKEWNKANHFTQNCVSVETSLPNNSDWGKVHSGPLPNGTRHHDKPVNRTVNSHTEHELGRHREMAVDVPDSFVGVSKTAPRYPPPKALDNSSDFPQGKRDFCEVKIAKESADTTQKRTRLDSANSSFSRDSNMKTTLDSNEHPCDRSTDSTSKDQLNKIRKYQDEIRKRREAEDKQAIESEFLRTSLRGSKKLQALEDNPPEEPKTGVVNTGYEEDSLLKSSKDLTAEEHVPELSQNYGALDLLQSLYRLKASLRGNGPKDADLLMLEGLICNKDFQNILAVHNKVQEVCCFKCPPTPVCTDAEDIVQEVMTSLQEASSPEAVELSDILSRYEFDGLVFSHDKIAARQSLPNIVPNEELLDRATQYTEGSVKIVKIDKTSEPLGATVRNEGEAVIIGRIVKGGAAEKSGLLHEGDEILEVNGVEMRGKSVNDVCDILATMTGTLTFLVVPAQYESSKNARDVVMHVKAHFDYDPDDDLYIPCRELGISFEKGDILHVINQEDANWWQAYREGEEEQALAGLIPSMTFQKQRESVKQAIVGETNAKEKSKKAKFLCAKKHNKKKRKKLCNSTSNEEFEADSVLTYEEVSLYYPRSNRKRPTVLIGPPNIGRHELRQKLMEDTDRFAAAVPHTSRVKRDAEVDGVDYHFISRSQFEADIVSAKFVEHGEYEKNYYGTSLDAIRAVVNSGKICVLNLHPQSLKILKSSDLKPYVVFVAPPSLEKLRQNRMKNGDYIKDDELKEIIEKAREMEETYGHFFDMVIINSDIDKAYNEVLKDINILEREPQWVPAVWLTRTETT